jgi:hypothetical protein
MPFELSQIVPWLTNHDIPNWIILGINVIWAVGVFVVVRCWRLWDRRKRWKIPHLVVRPFPGKQTIGGQEFDAIDFEFKNRTDQRVVLSDAQVRVRKRVPVPSASASADASGWLPLQFLSQSGVFGTASNGAFSAQTCILETNSDTTTGFAVSQQPPADLYNYKPGSLRRLFRFPKYFRLQYTATIIGGKTYCVDFVR